MADQKRSMRYVGDMEEEDGSLSTMQRDSANRLWLTNQKTGEVRMHPDSVEIEKRKRETARVGTEKGRPSSTARVGTEKGRAFGYSSGGKVRGCGAAVKGHGKGKMR